MISSMHRMRHRRPSYRAASLIAAFFSLGAVASATPAVTPPPPGVPFDYQIGGDYPLPAGVEVVTRDWFSGSPEPGIYSTCYINAFQTQADEPNADRPDERGNWPAVLVLSSLGDDPNWGGEYLVDISSAAHRRAATAWVKQMITSCAQKGFRAVEFDNLDSWTRFDDTPLAGRVPFEKRQAIAYARLLTRAAHRRGLAVGQKNTPQLGRRVSRRVIGFDFAVSEECGTYRECAAYTAVFGSRVFDIEYHDPGFGRACASIGARGSVIRRDRNVSVAGSPDYVFRSC
jgi:Glycoside-hydrolase family GH114